MVYSMVETIHSILMLWKTWKETAKILNIKLNDYRHLEQTKQIFSDCCSSVNIKQGTVRCKYLDDDPQQHTIITLIWYNEI